MYIYIYICIYIYIYIDIKTYIICILKSPLNTEFTLYNDSTADICDFSQRLRCRA